MWLDLHVITLHITLVAPPDQVFTLPQLGTTSVTTVTGIKPSRRNESGISEVVSAELGTCVVSQ
jgi:hypothetical protein